MLLDAGVVSERPNRAEEAWELNFIHHPCPPPGIALLGVGGGELKGGAYQIHAAWGLKTHIPPPSSLTMTARNEGGQPRWGRSLVSCTFSTSLNVGRPQGAD